MLSFSYIHILVKFEILEGTVKDLIYISTHSWESLISLLFVSFGFHSYVTVLLTTGVETVWSTITSAEITRGLLL